MVTKTLTMSEEQFNRLIVELDELEQYRLKTNQDTITSTSKIEIMISWHKGIPSNVVQFKPKQR
jgi:hypothetical protein